ncbi:hypothetical protein ACIQYM_37970, partial [Rhodococcus erythropolis]
RLMGERRRSQKSVVGFEVRKCRSLAQQSNDYQGNRVNHGSPDNGFRFCHLGEKKPRNRRGAINNDI